MGGRDPDPDPGVAARGDRQVAGDDRVWPRRQDADRQREFLHHARLHARRDQAASITRCSSTRPTGRAPNTGMFWDKLGRGEYDAGQYKRIGKGGREVWIQASYNPILDQAGKPFKVVKYATDITEQVKASEVLQAAVAQTQEVVGAAKENDLRHRIPLEGKTGDIAQLCGGVNGLLDTMSSMIGEISEIVADADDRRPRDRRRQHRPVAAHRRAGRQSRGDGRQHGGTDQHGAPERRKRAAGQQARRRRPPSVGGQGRCGGAEVVDNHERHHQRQPQDRRHHRRDRRDRVPDQYPGAQCRGRGGARRRPGTRLRGRRRGSPQSRPAQRQCRQGDQGIDLGFGLQGRIRHRGWSTPPARPWRRSSIR